VSILKHKICSSLGGIEPQTNPPFIPPQIKDYGVGIPDELVKKTLAKLLKIKFPSVQTARRDLRLAMTKEKD
jgi:hypothetical protein